jgi:hypothetical protein
MKIVLKCRVVEDLHLLYFALGFSAISMAGLLGKMFGAF